jgi:hypothetical protein
MLSCHGSTDSTATSPATSRRSSGHTARAVWLALEHQFLANREQHALYLDTAFQNFVQGDLSITDYCCKFKNMADTLGDLRGPHAILNVIRGLNEHFASLLACTFSLGVPSPPS